MASFQQMSSVEYGLEIAWECQFDNDILTNHPELKQHPIVQRNFLIISLIRTGVEPRPWFSIIGETIQYYDVMGLYPYICRYLKLPLGHPWIHAGNACPDKKPCWVRRVIQRYSTPRYSTILYNRSLQFLFCLFKTCAVECNFSGECVHETVEERSLTGT